MNLVLRLVMLGSIIGSASAVSASDNASSRPKKDPDEIVCEKQEVLGSRLATKRVCMTRSQWAEQRRGARDMVDKSQLGSCARQAGC